MPSLRRMSSRPPRMFGPLVVAAALHDAVVLLEHVVEVVALHYHVVELEEAQTLLHALLVALGAQHVVDGEAGADVAQQLDIVELEQPVGVVEHESLAVGEVYELAHLDFELRGVGLYLLLGEHLAHVGAAGGVADHRRAAAEQSYRTVARELEAAHQVERHEVADVQAVRRRIEAYIERCLPGVDEVADLLLVRELGN